MVTLESDIVQLCLERLELVSNSVFVNGICLNTLCEGGGETANRADVTFASDLDRSIIDEDGSFRHGIGHFQFGFDDQALNDSRGRIDAHGSVIRDDPSEGMNIGSGTSGLRYIAAVVHFVVRFLLRHLKSENGDAAVGALFPVAPLQLAARCINQNRTGDWTKDPPCCQPRLTRLRFIVRAVYFTDFAPLLIEHRGLGTRKEVQWLIGLPADKLW